MNKEALIDYLDEDPVIFSQVYSVISFLIPDKTNEISTPMLKIRGSYRTIEECEKQIKKLGSVDKYFSKFICSVGKWGGLYSEEEIQNQGEVDIVYRDAQLNSLMKEYKESRENADTEHMERQERMVKQSKEATNGEKIAETIIAVKSRLQFINAQMTDMNKKMGELKTLEEENLVLLSGFTEEELHQYELENNPDMQPSSSSTTLEEITPEQEEPLTLEEPLTPENFNLENFNKMFDKEKNNNVVESEELFKEFSYSPITSKQTESE